MPNNLGKISMLRDGLNGMYQFIESYKKIVNVTGATNTALSSIIQYYENNKRILKELEK